MPTSIFQWNPRRPIRPGLLGKALPVRKRVNNFGDLLGPLIVREIIRKKRFDAVNERCDHTLFSVGSVMHFASDGDTVWGTGINGKIPSSALRFTKLDVRAVRGPRTRRILIDMGIDCPEVYGDPALLLPHLFPNLAQDASGPKHEPTVIPNLNDISEYTHEPGFTNPRIDLGAVLQRIINSEFVVGSSLHAIVLAEAFRIPCRLLKSASESDFKYQDYFEGTGRDIPSAASSVEHALELGPMEALGNWNRSALLEAFPADLWADTDVNRHFGTKNRKSRRATT